MGTATSERYSQLSYFYETLEKMQSFPISWSFCKSLQRESICSFPFSLSDKYLYIHCLTWIVIDCNISFCVIKRKSSEFHNCLLNCWLWASLVNVLRFFQLCCESCHFICISSCINILYEQESMTKENIEQEVQKVSPVDMGREYSFNGCKYYLFWHFFSKISYDLEILVG